MPDPDSKCCAKCGCVKPLLDFGSNRRRKDGVQVYCRPCMRAYMLSKQYDKKRWGEKRDLEQARSAAYRAQNTERVRAVYRAQAARKRAENPGLIRKYNIARKHGERRATPPWADLALMAGLYKEARRLESEDGLARHVDHIVPLKHPLVCGLHAHTNLRVTLASDNMSKHNRFEIQ